MISQAEKAAVVHLARFVECTGIFRRRDQPTLLRYFATCAVVVVTLSRFASPCSNRGPTILSQSMKRLISLPMKPFLPYIAHVTAVLSPAGLKVKSTVATPSIGRFQ